MSGKILFKNFSHFYENKSKLLELCEVSKKFSQTDIAQVLEVKEEGRKKFLEFNELLSDFLSFCSDSIAGIISLYF